MIWWFRQACSIDATCAQVVPRTSCSGQCVTPCHMLLRVNASSKTDSAASRMSQECCAVLPLTSMNCDLCRDAFSEGLAKAAGCFRDKMYGTLQVPNVASDAASAPVHGCIEVQCSVLSKTGQAEKRFERTTLQHDTQRAWLAYANCQVAAVSAMGTPSKRKYTDAGLWNIFLGNSYAVSWLHSMAFMAYMQSKEEYDALPVQVRITKLTPLLMRYLESKNAVKAAAWKKGTAGAPGSRMSGNGKTPGKRPAEPLAGPGAQRQRVTTAGGQPKSSTVYNAVPVDQQTALQCADVGYQSNTESRPYSHSLRACLLAERRCLVCWETTHLIWSCPQSSQALRAGMRSKR